MNFEKIKEIGERFAINGSITFAERYGNGHINDTYLIKTDKSTSYILQRINTNVFRNPVGLMHNYVKVTRYMQKRVLERGGNPEREVITNINTKDGMDYLDIDEGFFRLSLFIDNAVCLDAVNRTEKNSPSSWKPM